MSGSIVFRVDAGVAMGLGHLSRCLTLAKALHACDCRILFLISPETANWAHMISEHDFEYRVLDVPADLRSADHVAHASWLSWGQFADAEACRNEFAQTPNWLVVDHYALDKSWEATIRSSVERLMVIDDLADREHDADVLLDQNVKTPTSYAHLVLPGCKTLIGPHYALLRNEFAEARPAVRHGAAARINVFMGGTDRDGVTLQVLDELAENPRWGKLDVILGARCPHLNAIRQLVDGLPRAEIHIDSGHVAKLFASADIGIGAGGVASLERCCVGLPSIGICVADNQAMGLDALMKLGAVESLGALSDLREGRIVAALSGLAAEPDRLRKMSRTAMALVDGQGARRVARIMLGNLYA